MHPTLHNIVLVKATFAAEGGETRSRAFGTGYLIRPDKVLTAHHAVKPGEGERRTGIEVWRVSTKRWLTAHSNLLWGSDDPDAALLALTSPVEDVVDVEFGTTTTDDQRPWVSSGFPSAAKVTGTDHSVERSTSGLSGTWYGGGGHGDKGSRTLDLGVDYQTATDWQGVSGAPVFVDDRLIGIVNATLEKFQGRRLEGVPIERLTQKNDFVVALEPGARPVPDGADWFVAVLAEGAGFETRETIRQALDDVRGPGASGDQAPVVLVDIAEELQSPARWLRFVELITRAQTAVIDVTDFQPAIMLALGVRAVARKGVTVAVTIKDLNEKHLATLPFNIKETRLVSLAGIGVDQLAATVEAGISEQRTDSAYLDLPAYQLVRARRPRPGEPDRKPSMLVLCAFSDEYSNDKYWQRVQGIASVWFKHKAVRMLDIDSPRLVGQALYEQIRWNPACIVDWTWWRPNVFFELGVRLACTDNDPVQLIHGASGNCNDQGLTPELDQLERLKELFRPAAYSRRIDGDEESDDERLHEARARYEAQRGSASPTVEDGMLPSGATHRSVAAAYDWHQEPVNRLPHDELRDAVEARVGKDPQKHATNTDTLFSSNSEFAAALEDRDRERWIAAWFYAEHALAADADADDGPARTALVDLGERVMQALATSPREADSKLRKRVGDVVYKWEP